jgi:DNA-binding transcriptional ArsR family regulator
MSRGRAPRRAARPTPQPRAGANFVQAARTPVGGDKRRRLLCLLAAYADVGVDDPPIRSLSRRLRLPVPTIDELLKQLERDGLVSIRWKAGQPNTEGHRRNRYELRLGVERAV